MKLDLKTVLFLGLILAGLVLLIIGITTLVNLRQDVGQAIAKVFVERTDRETTAIILTVAGGVCLVAGVLLFAMNSGSSKKGKKKKR